MPTHGAQQRASATTPARALIAAVKDADHVTIQRILRRPDLPKIAVELAARITAPRVPQPCGTRSAAERHIANGELLDDDCLHARRRFYRDRKRDQRRALIRDQTIALAWTDGTGVTAADAVIREWAMNAGMKVGARGRLRDDVRTAYQATIARREAGVA